MRARLIRKLFDTILGSLSEDMIKSVADDLIDVIENRLAESGGVTNQALLAAIGMLRTAAGIPDDIGGDED